MRTGADSAAPARSGRLRPASASSFPATSARTLARRVESALGTTPGRFAQRLRVARAVHLLETTREPVEAIAARVGYADPASFRRVFRRETGEAPSARRDALTSPGRNRARAD